MKYLNTLVGFREFPDEISLLINITNCPFHCKGCHSPELWEDIGTLLTTNELDKLIKSNEGITCIGFMGGLPKEILVLAKYVKDSYDLKVGWYFGGDSFPFILSSEYELFDYIKVGSYKKELGGLDTPTTNQKMFKISPHTIENITNKFYEKGI